MLNSDKLGLSGAPGTVVYYALTSYDRKARTGISADCWWLQLVYWQRLQGFVRSLPLVYDGNFRLLAVVNA